MQAASAELEKAVTEATGIAEQNRSAAVAMGSLNEEMVTKLDSVSAVVEENTAATEEMAAGSTEVTQAIENIASVSEENGAAVEEVSAAAEQMSAQVEEVSASADNLSQMASALQLIVRRFRLTDETAAQGVVWDETMATGVPEIDTQHKTLIEKLTELDAALMNGAAGVEVEEIFDFLDHYVQQHFGYEEDCMEKYRCPAAAKNREAHGRFVEKFNAMRRRLQVEGASMNLAIAIQTELTDWLVNHIRRVDTGLHTCVSRQPSQVQAAVAANRRQYADLPTG
jgi:hemerythrin-like metal-binding protein